MQFNRHPLSIAVVSGLSLVAGSLLSPAPPNGSVLEAIIWSAVILFVAVVAYCLGFQNAKRPPDAPWPSSIPMCLLKSLSRRKVPHYRQSALIAKCPWFPVHWKSTRQNVATD